MKRKRSRIRTGIVFSLLLILLAAGMPVNRMKAAGKGDVFTDAVAFYNKYGSGKIVFSEGAFYYSSRGKEGDPKGIRYGVLGQKFVMKIDEQTEYVLWIALQEESNPGSCKRISYIKKNGYYFSLYKVEYDRMYQRLHKKYPGVDFEAVMYNHTIHFQIDFLLCLVLDGNAEGKVTELDNGEVHISGTVYQKAEQVLNAADWSKETKEALQHYYGIQMDIYQPSVWYMVFHKNDPAASGKMEKQKFTYGEKDSLSPCTYQKVITVTLDPVEGSDRGEQLVPLSKLLKSQFQGWSLRPGGKKKYDDRQRIQNLTKKNKDQIHLYALWSNETMVFPDRKRDGCEFLGWGTKKMEPLPAKSTGSEIKNEKIYKAGSKYVPKKDITFYAVWRWKRYKIKFKIPDGEQGDFEVKRYYYNRKKIEKIRQLISECGFAGEVFNKTLMKRKLL